MTIPIGLMEIGRKKADVTFWDGKIQNRRKITERIKICSQIRTKIKESVHRFQQDDNNIKRYK